KRRKNLPRGPGSEQFALPLMPGWSRLIPTGVGGERRRRNGTHRWRGLTPSRGGNRGRSFAATSLSRLRNNGIAAARWGQRAPPMRFVMLVRPPYRDQDQGIRPGAARDLAGVDEEAGRAGAGHVELHREVSQPIALGDDVFQRGAEIDQTA